MIKRGAETHPAETRASSKTRRVSRITAFLLIASLLALAVSFTAVACGDDAAATGAEAAVQRFLTASENKDVEAVLELLDPQAVASMEADLAEAGMTLNDVKPLLAEELFPFESVMFSDIQLETTELGENDATVKITGGTMTQTSDGVTETKNAAESDDLPELYLVRIDGEWYIDFESME